MGKHSVQRESRLTGSVRGAMVIGALTTGAIALPAAPAMAATVNIPGIGDVQVPDLPQMPEIPGLPQLPAPTPGAEVPAAPAPWVGLPPAPGTENIPQAWVGIPPVHSTLAEKALDAARTKVGAQYVWGASGPYAFDCSGLVQWSYRQAGFDLPRTSFAMASVGSPVDANTIQPGDIVVQYGGSHVALYAGNGQIVHASTEGQPVKYAPLDWGAVYTARHIG